MTDSNASGRQTPSRLALSAPERLSRAWGCHVVGGATYVDHHERAVVECHSAHGPVVVKIDTVPHRFDREVRMLRAAFSSGMPVPKIIFTERTAETLLVLEKASGSPLTSEQSDVAWADAGRTLRRLHDLAVELPPFGGPGNWQQFMQRWLNQESVAIVADGLLEEAIARRLHVATTDAMKDIGEPTRRPIHGDCQPSHFFLDDNRVTALFDFGDTGLGDPLRDFAVLTLRDPAKLDPVLTGYLADDRLRARARAVVPAYRIMRHLSAARWLYRHGQDPNRELRALYTAAEEA